MLIKQHYLTEYVLRLSTPNVKSKIDVLSESISSRQLFVLSGY